MILLETAFWILCVIWIGFYLFGKNPEKSCFNALLTLVLLFIAIYLLFKACSGIV